MAYDSNIIISYIICEILSTEIRAKDTTFNNQ
jgi:hypothetical protein